MNKEELLDKQEEFSNKVKQLIVELYDETGMMVNTINNKYIDFNNTNLLMIQKNLEITYKIGKDIRKK